jgi:hypothetical protein
VVFCGGDHVTVRRYAGFYMVMTMTFVPHFLFSACGKKI